jgi:hypothetical protein
MTDQQKLAAHRQRLFEARRLGPLATYRLRAELLLEKPDLELSNIEREELERIAASPRKNDLAYLQQWRGVNARPGAKLGEPRRKLRISPPRPQC